MTEEKKLPVLIVGDVHGDLRRLFKALEPYPPNRWRTVFLGDLVDGGDFGVGALRYAHDRPNSTVLLGNHEVAMLWTLRDRSRLNSWMGLGGQLHDLDELDRDPDLQDWVRALPALHKLEDGTLCQHSDNDNYGELADRDEPDVIGAVNRETARLLATGGESVLWDLMSPGGIFRASRLRLEAWLGRTGSTRLVHGHKYHGKSKPDAYDGGLAISYDGGLSRYHRPYPRGLKPLSASVGPLPSVS